MKLKNLLSARLKKRYKRFLADVVLADGTELTAHCPNTGSMRGCLAPGNPVMLSRSGNPARRFPFTLEMIQVDGCWVGINTARTNHLVREAIENGVITDFGVVNRIQPEIKVSAGSRLDFLLMRGTEKIYMEVKNCTLVEGGRAMFPDAITSRGAKHLRELAELARGGHEAVIFFCVQRTDGEVFAPAAHIDPLYARTLAEVVAQGVKVLAYQAVVGPAEIRLTHALPVQLAE